MKNQYHCYNKKMKKISKVSTNEVSIMETVSSAYVPPFQLTEGQPPPFAANGGLSYMSFDQDGDAGTAAAMEAALNQIAEGKGQAVIHMLDNAPPGPIETKRGIGFRGYSECLEYIRANNIESPEGGLALPLRYTVHEQPSYSIVSSNALWRDSTREGDAKALRKEERDQGRRCLYFPQVLRDARRMKEYQPGLSPNSPECMDKLGVSLAHCESKCENFYDAEEVERVFYPEMEKLLLEYFPGATDALVYNHDVFDKDYEGDRKEDQDNKIPGVNAGYANLVHNDLNDNSGRVRCRELLTKNLRNFGREQHYRGGSCRSTSPSRWRLCARTPSCSAPGPLSLTNHTSPTIVSTTTVSARPHASPIAPTTIGTGFPSRNPLRFQCSSATTLSLTARYRAGPFTPPASTQPRLMTLPAAGMSWSDPTFSSKKTKCHASGSSYCLLSSCPISSGYTLLGGERSEKEREFSLYQCWLHCYLDTLFTL